jgi:glycosyltransferase involved in cell wall biosynthesis
VDKPEWICCQIGAREHYAVPRSLLRKGASVRLVTDVWAASNSICLPKRWRQRSHAEISDQEVIAWNVSALCHQGHLKLRRRGLWQTNVSVNDWFQRKVCRVLPALVDAASAPITVFAYSYAAREIFRVAKTLGCRTILGQIDPGPAEMRIVKAIERRYCDLQSEWPDQMYWDNWRSECDQADAIVVNSEWSRLGLLNENISADRVHIVPLAYDGVDSPFTHTREIPDCFGFYRPLRVLFLGQVIPRKGALELAEAIQLLAKRPVAWFIVGHGPPDLLARFRGLPRTTVTGAVSRNQAAGYYQQADVFILPTHSDGFALTQLEAQSFGLPVIASGNCGDVVSHGNNGLRLPDVSAGSIVDSVEQLLQSPQLLQSLASNCRVEARFSLDALGEQMIRLHHNLVGIQH